jgi:oligosaccharide repeat unit polymerase
MFAEAGIFALFASDEPNARWRRWLGYALIPLVALIVIQKGDRTALIALGVGAGWCYTQRIRRLGWMPVLAVAFSALVVMPVIGEWRSQRSLEASKQRSVYELFGSSLYNMGSSVNAIIYTVELVPAEKNYAWGETFMHAAIQAIPNVSLTKGKEFVETSIEDSPSLWITWVIAPEWAAANGGYGFAMAAEWYYNFGMVGILVGMALSGWAMARARNAARNSSLALVWSATLFAALTIWVRNVVGYALKFAVWPIVGLWIISRLLGMLRRRGRVSAVARVPEPFPQPEPGPSR